ncbi:MAG: diphthine--ammonia ligase [Porphyromonas sp.]|nr:diphthine--ammonia ligase [Porphyromonas sp.]
MKILASWSGGKDCMLALHKAIQMHSPSEIYLLNMCDNDGSMSRSHGLSALLMQAQAEAMGLYLLQVPVERDAGGYEASFKKGVSELMNKGVTHAVFGDIYLETHRTWVERVSEECGITPIFPLWGIKSEEVVRTLIDEKFRTVIVSIRKGKLLPGEYLGKELSHSLLDTLASIPGIDPCGENGEYHTFVYDGPLFQKPLPFRLAGQTENDKHYFYTLQLL